MSGADRDSARRSAADWWVRLRAARHDDPVAVRWLEWTQAHRTHLESFERIEELAGQLGALDGETRADWRAEFVPTPWWRRAGWRIGAVAAVLAGVALGVVLLRPSQDPRAAIVTASFSTPVAVDRDLALSDGSHVALGGASELRTAFAPDLRKVDLARGEAFFEVAHDRARPFIVAAGAVSIRAVGTAFNVRRTGDRVTIAVTEGRVRITGSDGDAAARVSGADALEAVAGQQVAYDPHATGLAVIGISPAQATGWRDHRLEFVNEPLDVVVANINRYSLRPVRIEDAQAGALAFTGTVRPDALDGWLRALGRILPVRIGSDADGVTLASAERKPR